MTYGALVIVMAAGFWMGATREEGFDIAAGLRFAALPVVLMCLLFVVLLWPVLSGKDPDAIHRIHEKTAIEEAETGDLWFVLTGCGLGVVMAFFGVPAALGMSFDSSQTETFQQVIGRFLFCVGLALIFIPIGSTLGFTLWLTTLSRSQPPQMIEEILQRNSKPFIPLLTPLMLSVGKRTIAKSVAYHKSQKEN